MLYFAEKFFLFSILPCLPGVLRKRSFVMWRDAPCAILKNGSEGDNCWPELFFIKRSDMYHWKSKG